MTQYDGRDHSATPTAIPAQTAALPTGLMLGGLAAGLAWVLGDKSYQLVSHTFPGLLSYTSLPLDECSKMILTNALAWGEHKPATFASWMLWLVLPSIAAGVAAGIWGYKSSIIKPVIQRSGPRLVWEWEIPKGKKKDGEGIKITENLKLTLEAETQNILVVAKIGAGKTVAIMPMLAQANERQDCTMTVDYKSDFAQKFGDESYQVAPWIPNAKNGVKWLIGRDVRNAADAKAFAESLIPESQDPIWAQAARGVVEGIVMNLQTSMKTEWGWNELADMLKDLLSETAKLAKAIADHRPLIAARITEMSAETRESIFFNIVTFSQDILDIAEAESNVVSPHTWSITEWVAGEKPRVILGWRAENESMSKRIILPILKMTFQRLLSSPDRKPWDEMKYWIFCDECANLGVVPGLTQAVAALRSKGGRIVLGFQSFGQIAELYGEGLAQTIVGMETMLIGRLLNPKDQKEASDLCGTGLFDRIHITQTQGGGTSQTKQRTEEPIYRTERFARLGKTDNGVKFVYVGRNIVSEVLVKFPPQTKIKFEKDD